MTADPPGPVDDDAPSYDEALDGLLTHARAAVENWTYLRDARITTLGEAISPAGTLVELSNALYHLAGHLDDLDRAVEARTGRAAPGGETT